MSYPSNSPHQASPLADKSWRLRHSAWMLAPILGCGMLSFVGFLYVAIRVQSKKFWIAAAIGCLGSATIWVVLALTGDLEESGDTTAKAAESTDSMSDIGLGVTLAVWAALLVYAFVLNRDYLRFRAGMFESRAWYNQPVGNAAGNPNLGYAPPQANHQPQAPGFLGVNQSDYFAGPAQPVAPSWPAAAQQPARQQAAAPVPPVSQTPAAQAPGPIDVNAATASTLAAGLGIDPSLAARVVAVRDSRGGYATLDELVSTAGLQPHELLKFRGKVTFGQAHRTTNPQASPQPPTPNKDRPGGRIIDI